MDAVPIFSELLESELPSWLPRPEPPAGADVAWFRGVFELDELETLEVYVLRVGNGGNPPFRLTVLSGITQGPGDEARAAWPTFPQLWAAINETCLTGGLFRLPAHVAGFEPQLEGQAVTVVDVEQAGAIAGSAAYARFALANPGKIARMVRQ